MKKSNTVNYIRYNTHPVRCNLSKTIFCIDRKYITIIYITLRATIIVKFGRKLLEYSSLAKPSVIFQL